MKAPPSRKVRAGKKRIPAEGTGDANEVLPTPPPGATGTDPAGHSPAKEPTKTRRDLELRVSALERALEESSSLFRKSAGLYDVAPVGFLSLDAKGSIVEANQMSATLLGTEQAHLQRRSLTSFIAVPNRREVRSFLRRVFDGPGREFCEVALAKPTKAIGWIGLHGSLEDVPAGSPPRCWLAISDLTDRRRVSEELRASETRYRRLFEAAHDGVLLLDPATRKITDANPFMTRLLGYSRDALIGKELFEIGLLRDEATSKDMFRRLQRKHAVRYEDLPLADRTGRLHEVEVVANLYEEAGRPVIQCNIRDITARRQTEELLRRNEALLFALVEEAPLGMYVINSRFQLVQANPPACAAFRNVSPLVGRDFGEILRAVWPPRVADQLARRFRQTLLTGEFFQSSTFAAKRQDSGARESYEWQIQQVPLPDGHPGVVCFFSDVTERNRLEAAARRVAVLAAANAKLAAEVTRRKAVELSLVQSRQQKSRLLVEAQEMQAQLRNLSRSVIKAQEEERRLISRELHDVIAQMLTGISLRLGNLGAQAGLGPADLQRNITATQDLVARSVETVHQFARELRPSVLDDLGLVPALHTYLKSFAARTGLRSRMTVCKEADLLSVAHRTVLFRVAQEALTNVARHAGAGRVDVILRPEPGGFGLQVIDDGRAFHVDRVLHGTRGGRLGLLGMRERLDMVGGRLDIQSTPGIGTTIAAFIPLTGPALSHTRPT
jgi:PAS domain S-box-containing protein